MRQNLFQAFCLASIILVAQSSNSPVLSRLGESNIGSHSIGDIVDTNRFERQLEKALGSGDKPQDLTVILVKSHNDDEEPSRQMISEMSKFEIENDSLYQPQVRSPSLALNRFLQTHPNVNARRVDVDSISDGLFKFVEAQNANKPVILLKEEAVRRDKRDTAESSSNNKEKEKDEKMYVWGEECAAFFESVTMLDETSEAKSIVALDVEKESLSFSCPKGYKQPQILTIKFKNGTLIGKPISQISFTFVQTNNTLYSILNTTTLTLDGKETYPLIYMGTPYNMETPLTFSFACTRAPFLLRHVSSDPKNNFKALFYINTLQLQSGNLTSNTSNFTFGQVNYCQGFFTSGIWMAITSSLLLALILAFGVTALITIKTNDRLDDPKGKPLNIGQEK